MENERLQSSIYEIEGLLMLLERDKADASKAKAIKELIKMRLTGILDVIDRDDDLVAEAAPAEETPMVETPAEQPKQTNEPDPEEIEEALVANEELEEVADEATEIIDETAEELSDDEAMAESAEYEEVEDADESIGEIGGSIDDVLENVRDEEPEKAVVEEAPKLAPQDIDDLVITIDDIDETLPEPATVNEKIFVQSADRSLRNAFTLNDKFRFRRELFNNSDSEFAAAIKRIEKMGSAAEADEYFYCHLGWDPDKAEVHDFMQLIHSFLP